MPGATERALSRFGLAVLCLLLASFLVAMTILYPPWVRVTCNRLMGLYISQQQEVLSSSFAGFDYLFAEEKKAATWTPPNPGSGTSFQSREFNVWWILLYIEWFVIFVAALLSYIYFCHHMRSDRETSMMESSKGAQAM